LSLRLRPYGVKPVDVRANEEVKKGYRRTDLHDAWQRYVPEEPKKQEEPEEPDEPEEPPESEEPQESAGGYVAEDADPGAFDTPFEHDGEQDKSESWWGGCVADKPIPPPIKTFGGKGNHHSLLARWILSHAQPHRCYVEPFLGGGSVLLAKSQSYEEVVGDLDPLRANLWAVLKSPEQFPTFLEAVGQIKLPFERETWEHARAQLREHPDAEPWARAAWYFTVSRLSRAGDCRGFLTDSTRPRRGMDEHESAWLSAIKNLPRSHERLSVTTVLSPTPAVDVIRRYSNDPEVLIYSDPPYVHSTRVTRDNYGEHEMSTADHRELLLVLRRCRGQVLLSGYDSPLYREMLPGWQIHQHETKAHSGGGKSKSQRVELLWSNR